MFHQSLNKIAGSLILMLKTSSSKSAENSSSLIDVAKNANIGDSGGDCKEKIDEKSLHSKNLNRAIGYLTSDIKQAFT